MAEQIKHEIAEDKPFELRKLPIKPGDFDEFGNPSRGPTVRDFIPRQTITDTGFDAAGKVKQEIQNHSNQPKKCFQTDEELQKIFFTETKSPVAECNLYIANLPDYATDIEVARIFSELGELVSFKLVPKNVDATGSVTKNAYLTYKHREAALVAMQNLNNTTPSFAAEQTGTAGQRRPMWVTINKMAVRHMDAHRPSVIPTGPLDPNVNPTHPVPPPDPVAPGPAAVQPDKPKRKSRFSDNPDGPVTNPLSTDTSKDPLMASVLQTTKMDYTTIQAKNILNNPHLPESEKQKKLKELAERDEKVKVAQAHVAKLRETAGGFNFSRDTMAMARANQNATQAAAAIAAGFDDNQTAVFIAKLHPETDKEGLQAIFSKYGTITRCNVVYDDVTKMSKCYGFVHYTDINDCYTAIRAMNGQPNSTLPKAQRLVVKMKGAPQNNPTGLPGGEITNFNSKPAGGVNTGYTPNKPSTFTPNGLAGPNAISSNYGYGDPNAHKDPMMGAGIPRQPVPPGGVRMRPPHPNQAPIRPVPPVQPTFEQNLAAQAAAAAQAQVHAALSAQFGFPIPAPGMTLPHMVRPTPPGPRPPAGMGPIPGMAQPAMNKAAAPENNEIYEDYEPKKKKKGEIYQVQGTNVVQDSRNLAKTITPVVIQKLTIPDESYKYIKSSIEKLEKSANVSVQTIDRSGEKLCILTGDANRVNVVVEALESVLSMYPNLPKVQLEDRKELGYDEPQPAQPVQAMVQPAAVAAQPTESRFGQSVSSQLEGLASTYLSSNKQPQLSDYEAYKRSYLKTEPEDPQPPSREHHEDSDSRRKRKSSDEKYRDRERRSDRDLYERERERYDREKERYDRERYESRDSRSDRDRLESRDRLERDRYQDARDYWGEDRGYDRGDRDYDRRPREDRREPRKKNGWLRV